MSSVKNFKPYYATKGLAESVLEGKPLYSAFSKKKTSSSNIEFYILSEKQMTAIENKLKSLEESCKALNNDIYMERHKSEKLRVAMVSIGKKAMSCWKEIEGAGSTRS